MNAITSPKAGSRMRKKLNNYIGKAVTVQNIAHEQGDKGKFQFCMNGMLEAPVEDDPNYHLRVKECYEGTSGMSFNERHLAAEDGIYIHLSGRIQITLR